MNMSMDFWRSSLETKHFAFEAFGHNKLRARATLLKTLATHGKQYRLPADWYEPLIVDIVDRELKLNRGYRDGAEIYKSV